MNRIWDAILVLLGRRSVLKTNTYLIKHGTDIVVSIDGPDIKSALVAVWALSKNPHYWTFTSLGQEVMAEAEEVISSDEDL